MSDELAITNVQSPVTQAEFARMQGVTRKTITLWKRKGWITMTAEGLVDTARSADGLAQRRNNRGMCPRSSRTLALDLPAPASAAIELRGTALAISENSAALTARSAAALSRAFDAAGGKISPKMMAAALRGVADLSTRGAVAATALLGLARDLDGALQ